MEIEAISKSCSGIDISPQNAKVLLLAFTFREGAKNGKCYVYSGLWITDFKRLIDNLEKKFGGT